MLKNVPLLQDSYTSLAHAHTLERKHKMENEEDTLLDYGSMTFNVYGGFTPAKQDEVEWVSPELGVIE